MHRSLNRLIAIAAMPLMLANSALAHVGEHGASSLSAGFLHPFTGLDHLLAMFLVGVLAAQLGGRSLWLLPVTFVVALIAGCGVAMAHLPIGFVEAGIAASVVVLGALVALQVALPHALLVAAIAMFGVFHGYAHGSELPSGGDVLSFVIGFVSATALLHAIGVGTGLAINRSIVMRVSGATAMLAGMVMLFNS